MAAGLSSLSDQLPKRGVLASNCSVMALANAAAEKAHLHSPLSLVLREVMERWHQSQQDQAEKQLRPRPMHELGLGRQCAAARKHGPGRLGLRHLWLASFALNKCIVSVETGLNASSETGRAATVGAGA